MTNKPIIQIEDLNKTFGEGGNAVVALDSINLSVDEGEIFGIIGLSGAGKSTLVRCINLLEEPTAGRIIFDGRDITLLSDRELRQVRRSIGMIFQGFNLLMQRSAIDNVCFPLELAGVPRRESRDRERELLATVGLADKEKAYPAQLSGDRSSALPLPALLPRGQKCCCAMRRPVRWIHNDTIDSGTAERTEPEAGCNGNNNHSRDEGYRADMQPRRYY